MATQTFRHPAGPAIRRLLAEAKLPVADLTEAHLEHFFGCGLESSPYGVVGMELYGRDALLRSLAVAHAAQRRGCARALVERAEAHAREHGVRRIFLLTTGAAEFFAHLGYKIVGREEAPRAIRATQEFSALCPASAALMAKEIAMQAVQDASHLYEVEERAVHAERPGFRISELRLSPTQKVPWHFHSNVSDTFYVLEGTLRIFLQNPKEEVRLAVGETYQVPPRRPHLVANGGQSSASFLVLQGMGEYDFVPLLSSLPS